MAGWPSGGGSASSIRGVPVASTTPTTGQVLAYDGTQYAPSSASGGGITQLTGDVTTAAGSGSQAATVAQIQGRAVSSTAPTSGQALSWNGSAWAPASVVQAGAFSSSGLTGGAQTIPYFAANGSATTLTAPASKVNQVLGWDASGNLAWVAQMASVMLFAGSQYVTDTYIIERYDVAFEAPNGIVTTRAVGIDTATGIV